MYDGIYQFDPYNQQIISNEDYIKIINNAWSSGRYQGVKECIEALENSSDNLTSSYEIILTLKKLFKELGGK